MAFMLIVDNPGGRMFAPFNHADWNGFTPTDFVFPTFVFVMGVSMFLSLRKQEFKLSWKVLKRFVLLLGIGLLCNWISKCVWGGRIVGLENVRLSGVLVRLALCYGLSALIVCTVSHKWLGGGRPSGSLFGPPPDGERIRTRPGEYPGPGGHLRTGA